MIAWSIATALLAAAPVVYFATGASDSASEGSRIALAAVPMAAAWLVLSATLAVLGRDRAARRAAGLVALATLMLIVARALANASTIYGDRAWLVYWSLCVLAWVAFSLFACRTPG